MIEVLRSGPLTTIQDLGRPGFAHLGVGRSGAADRPSLRLANRLVGNPEGSSALELTFGGLALRATEPMTIAATGARCTVRVDGREQDMFAALSVPAGSTIEFGMPSRGVRTYVAFRGGLECELVLGSAATDVLSHLGPEPVREGDVLKVGAPEGSVPAVDVVPVRQLPDEVVLRVVTGPRADWFTPDALDLLGRSRFEATPASDRIGVRLDGAELQRTCLDELPSEGMVEGAVQVTPDGHPVIFLADHPVTGGYPVIAVVHPDDIALAAQLRPGQSVRFDVRAPIPVTHAVSAEPASTGVPRIPFPATLSPTGQEVG
ncbi:allophanate hydrolase [Knoellia sinensis KCTC 19936]|uniref:Allophanate hydrolase n=1 Tax=Knoellia sinensis KCTC 19936 TaxID=1385520 RepID=A0A0A0J489_9MICO|nr:biotin-dependent carboxyltransferase family protein [Knoellia sinensis]KGN31504.1 allophanate hydrolase [Knoellia sinensis KCTC 19936]